MRPLIALSLLSVLVASGVGGQVQPKPQHILDLVGISVPETTHLKAGTALWPETSGGRAGQRKPVALKLTLLDVDRTDYTVGDPIEYRVLLENQGQEPVPLPWSPDPGPFLALPTRAQGGVVLGSLFLEVRKLGSEVRLAWLDPQLLYGAPSVPGSIETLAPGEQALIRVPGVWRTTGPERERILRAPQGTVQVGAVLSLGTGAGSLVSSANSIQVQVHMPPRFGK